MVSGQQQHRQAFCLGVHPRLGPDFLTQAGPVVTCDRNVLTSKQSVRQLPNQDTFKYAR